MALPVTTRLHPSILYQIEKWAANRDVQRVGDLVLKAAPAAVYQVTESNAAAAGFLVLINATASPASRR